VTEPDRAVPLTLCGRVAIVTGGAGGIGLCTSRALLRHGASVVSVDLDQDKVDRALADLRTVRACSKASGQVDGITADVSSEAGSAHIAEWTLARFGQIDILVSAAGILRAPGSGPKPAVSMSVGEWDAVIAANLRGTFLANRAVLPSMIARRTGHVINVSSLSGRQGRALDAAYCASKFGVIGLTESVAEEVSRYGVKVTVILPDVVDTPLLDQNGPIPRPDAMLAPERVADLIVYLLSMPDDTVLVAPVLRPARNRRQIPMARKGDTTGHAS
jgi:3-oxoacyl-[acyl-carrier protein] reductase